MNCQVNPSQRAAIEGLKFALEKIQARSEPRSGSAVPERFFVLEIEWASPWRKGWFYQKYDLKWWCKQQTFLDLTGQNPDLTNKNWGVLPCLNPIQNWALRIQKRWYDLSRNCGGKWRNHLGSWSWNHWVNLETMIGIDFLAVPEWLHFWCSGWSCKLSRQMASYSSLTGPDGQGQPDWLLCITGWWFGTFFIFPYIGNDHPNWLIFFRGVETTNQI